MSQEDIASHIEEALALLDIGLEQESEAIIQKLLVPPNRFRPESQGGLGGSSHGGGDKSFLHAHSAMLVKILNLNLALKDAFLESSRKDG